MKNMGNKKYPTEVGRYKGFAFGKTKFATETRKHQNEIVFLGASVPPWQKIFNQKISGKGK